METSSCNVDQFTKYTFVDFGQEKLTALNYLTSVY